jgi:internalin A
MVNRTAYIKIIQVWSMLLIFSIQIPVAIARPHTYRYQQFIDWCRNQKTLPSQTRQTIKVMLSLVKTQDCADAQAKLLNTEYLNFDTTSLSKPDDGGSDPISDLSPLTSLPHLMGLDLYANQVTDLSPLAKLPHLTQLRLDRNQIRDLTPLSTLSKLTSLELRDNLVQDLRPLAKLKLKI